MVSEKVSVPRTSHGPSAIRRMNLPVLQDPMAGLCFAEVAREQAMAASP